jgi:hypothetical protein
MGRKDEDEMPLICISLTPTIGFDRLFISRFLGEEKGLLRFIWARWLRGLKE